MTIQTQPVRPSRQASPPPTRPTREAPSSRLPFWLGFVTSFVVLTLLSVGLLLMSTGLDNINLADLQNNEAAWTPPEIIPTPTVDPSVVTASGVGAATTGQYATGTTLRNISEFNVYIRQTPGFMSKPGSDVIDRIVPGGTVEIIGGPATADGLTWWQVRRQASDGSITEGWSAEANNIQLLGPVQ